MNENSHFKKQITKARDMGLFESKLDNVQKRKGNVDPKLRKQINNLAKSNERLRKEMIDFAIKKGLEDAFK